MPATALTVSAKPLPVRAGLPLIGSTYDLAKMGPLQVFVDGWVTHGDAFAVDAIGRRLAVLAHPDMIQQVLVSDRDNFIKGAAYDEFRKLGGEGLVSSEGARWKRDRRLAQPAFHRKQIAALGELIADCTASELTRLREVYGDQPFDLSEVMMRLALVIMGHALFDQDLGDSASETAPAMTDALRMLVARSNEPFTLPLVVPTPGNLQLKRALNTLDGHVMAVLDRYNDADPSDRAALLLRMLVDARDDESGEAFTISELRDQVITLFVAGHETTALTLTWCFSLLSEQPEVLAKAHAEVDAVLGDRTPTFEDVRRLPYLKQVLEETMRVRPPLWAVARNAVEAREVCGFTVDAGDWVLIPIYIAHRHPDFWEDPERFDPERFAPEARKGRHPAAFIPFSHGPRRCIGDQFALTEMIIGLAMILQQGDIEVPEGPPGWLSQLSLRPDRPIQARMRWR